MERQRESSMSSYLVFVIGIAVVAGYYYYLKNVTEEVTEEEQKEEPSNKIPKLERL